MKSYSWTGKVASDWLNRTLHAQVAEATRSNKYFELYVKNRNFALEDTFIDGYAFSSIKKAIKAVK